MDTPPRSASFQERRNDLRIPSDSSLCTCKTSLTPSSTISEPTSSSGATTTLVGTTYFADEEARQSRDPTQMQLGDSAPSATMKASPLSNARASPAIGIPSSDETAALMTALMSEAELGAATQHPATPNRASSGSSGSTSSAITGKKATQREIEVLSEVMMGPVEVAQWAAASSASAEPLTSGNVLARASSSLDRSRSTLAKRSSRSSADSPPSQAQAAHALLEIGAQDEGQHESGEASKLSLTDRDVQAELGITGSSNEAAVAPRDATRPSLRPIQAAKSDDSSHCCDSIQSKGSLFRSGSDVSTIPTTPDKESDASMIPESALDAKQLRREIYRDRNYDDGYQIVRDERAWPTERKPETRRQISSSQLRQTQPLPQVGPLPQTQQHKQQYQHQSVQLSGYQRESSPAGQPQSSRSSADAYCLRTVQSSGALPQRGRPLPTSNNEPLPTRGSSRLYRTGEGAPQSYRAPQEKTDITNSRPYRSRSETFSSGFLPVAVQEDVFAAGAIRHSTSLMSTSTAQRRDSRDRAHAQAPIRPASRASGSHNESARQTGAGASKERLQRSRSDLNDYLSSAAASARARTLANPVRPPHRAHDETRTRNTTSRPTGKVHAPPDSHKNVSVPGNTVKVSHSVPNAEVLDLESFDSPSVTSDPAMDVVDSVFERKQPLVGEPLSPCYPPSRRSSKQLRHSQSAHSGPSSSTTTLTSQQTFVAPTKVLNPHKKHERTLSRIADTIKRHSWLRSSSSPPISEACDENHQTAVQQSSAARGQAKHSFVEPSMKKPQSLARLSSHVPFEAKVSDPTSAKKPTNVISNTAETSPGKGESGEMEDFLGLGDMVFAASLTRSNDDMWERAMEKAYEESTVKENNTASPLMSDAEGTAVPPSESQGTKSGTQIPRGKILHLANTGRKADAISSCHASTGAEILQDSADDIKDARKGAGEDCFSLEVNAGPSYESLVVNSRSHLFAQPGSRTQGSSWTGSRQVYTAEPSQVDDDLANPALTTRGEQNATRHPAHTNLQNNGISAPKANNTISRQRGQPDESAVALRRSSNSGTQEYKSLRRSSRPLHETFSSEQKGQAYDDRSEASPRPLSSTPTASSHVKYQNNTPGKLGQPRRPSSAMAFEDTKRTQHAETVAYERRPSFSIVDDGEFLQALESVRSQNKVRIERQYEAEQYARREEANRLPYGDDSGVVISHNAQSRSRSKTTDGLQVDTRPDTLQQSEAGYYAQLPPLEQASRSYRTPLELGVGKASGKIRDSAFWNDEDWKREVKALFVIREMVLTERSYATHLEALLRAVEVVQRMNILARLNSANGMTLTQGTRNPQLSGAHITDLLSLLPRMITVSHKLANLIDDCPTAAGVGAAFCAVSVELKAIFVEWSCMAKSIHEALRISEDPKGKGQDQIGLISVASSSQLSSVSGTSATTSTISSCHTPSTSSCSPVDDDGWHLPQGTLRMSLSRNTSLLKKEQGDLMQSAKRRSTLPGRPLAQSGSISKSTENSHASSSYVSAKAETGTRKRSLTNRSRKSDSTHGIVPMLDDRRGSDPSAMGSEASQSSPAHGMNQASKKMTAMDIAIMPTQRIPRYLLLLRDLHGNTPASSLSCVRLQRTIVFMEGVAASCDQVSGDLSDLSSVPSSSKTSSSKHNRSLSSTVMAQSMGKPSAARAMARARSFASTSNFNNNSNNSGSSPANGSTTNGNSQQGQKSASKAQQHKSMPDVAPIKSMYTRQHERESRDFFHTRPKSPSIANAFAA